MIEFKNILVPVDFEPLSTEAIGVATAVALRYSAAITLVHVYERKNYGASGGTLPNADEQLRRALDDARDRLEASKRKILADGVLDVKASVLEGVVAPEILALAKRGRYDLIVIGTHGRGGVWHQLLGSVAERVVQSAPCPVLTVRTQESEAA